MVFTGPLFGGDSSLGTLEAYADETIVYLNIGANGFNEGNTSFAGDKAITLTSGPDYNPPTIRNYSPSLSNGAIQIVQDRERQTGAAFLSRKIHSESGFSAMFNIWMGNSTGSNQPYTADGWAFVVSKSPNGVGGGGGGCGYAGLRGSFGIVYDVYNNNDYGSVNYPLIRFSLTGDDGVSSNGSRVGFTVTQDELNDLLSNGMSSVGGGNGNMYNRRNYPLYCWVDYRQSDSTIEYYVSVTPTKPTTPTLTQAVDAGFIASLGEDYYIGFTGANAAIRQGFDLRQLYIANDYLPGVLAFNPEGSGLSDSITSIEDYTAPNAPSIMQVGTESGSNTVAFTLSGSSDINGLRYYQYSLDGGTTWTRYLKEGTLDPVLDGSKKITAPIDDSDADGDGDATQLRVLARVIDNGGNISNVTTQSLAEAVIPHSTLTSPPADAVDVFFADAQSLVIGFSNEMDITVAGTVNITAPSSSVALAGGQVVAGDSRWNAEHTRLTLPLSAVDWGKTYTVEVEGFKNTGGVFLNGGVANTETFTYSVIARESTPTGTINYDAETLTGLTNDAKYKVNGTEYTASGTGTIPILAGWLGQNISIVKEGIPATPTYDSAAQSLAVPARPGAPTVSIAPGTIGTSQGDLYYASTAAALSGTDLVNGPNSVANGTYYVRQKADTSPYPNGSFRSEARQVEIAAQIYTLTVSAPAFSAIAFGDPQPAAQNLTIANIGNTMSTINSVVSSSADFVIGGSGGSVDFGTDISTWTVRPAAGLAVGVHTATITVTYQTSRTATANVSIIVKEAAPVPVIDYVNERISGLVAGQLYSVNGETAVNASSAGGSGVIAIKPEWLGTSLNIVKYNSTGSLVSDAAPLTIPARPGPPAGVAVGETFTGFADGKINNVTTALEFSADSGNSWRDVTAGEAASGIQGLAADSTAGLAAGNAYRLRVKASNGTQVFHSTAQVLTVAASLTAATYTVSLSPLSPHDFGSVVYGYPSQTALTVTVANTGNQPTGTLGVALSGTNGADFTLSTTSVGSIAVGGSNTAAFTVKPNDGLGAGVHTATVTVSGANGLTADFAVSFTVTAAQITGFSNPSSVVAGEAGVLLAADADYGDVTKAAAKLLALYSTVSANYPGGSAPLTVTAWTNIANPSNVGSATYDILEVGEYIFEGTLDPGSYPANVGNAANLKPVVSVIINDITHGVTLGQSGTYSVGTAEYGYTNTNYEHAVSITNIGIAATGELLATLGAPDAGSFGLSNGGVVGSIAIAGSSTALKVTPVSGLAPGTYTASLTLAGNEVGNTALIPKSYSVQFTVTQAQITGFAAIGDVPAGAANAATYATPGDVIAVLPTAVIANFAGGQTTVPVLTWVDTDGYDPTVAGSYTFTATLGAIPGNFLNGGGYTATVEVVVTADKAPLGSLISAVSSFVSVHRENYAAGQLQTLDTALANAAAVFSNAGATQGEVDGALLALQAAYEALVHAHPVEAHSHAAGLSEYGKDVTIKIKGNFDDVTGFFLNGQSYTLSPAGADTLNIAGAQAHERGKITRGSAVVTLPAAWVDKLADGTYTVVVLFDDNHRSGSGQANVVLQREDDDDDDDDDDDVDDDDEDDDVDDDGDDDDVDDDGALPGAGEPISPQTGDTMNFALWFVLIAAALAALVAVAVLRQRRRGAAKRE
ncbi:MAG: hypothetical protein LBN12_05065 [Clostridiales Family XIII bacterium]|nr:hypothetical protein [Clostridiales Family XIII bacterium]